MWLMATWYFTSLSTTWYVHVSSRIIFLICGSLNNRQPASSTAFVLATLGPKEHSTSTRIKAIYILENKKSLGQIREATGVSRSAVYPLAAIARKHR
jgi:hypothetical protein